METNCRCPGTEGQYKTDEERGGYISAGREKHSSYTSSNPSSPGEYIIQPGIEMRDSSGDPSASHPPAVCVNSRDKSRLDSSPSHHHTVRDADETVPGKDEGDSGGCRYPGDDGGEEEEADSGVIRQSPAASAEDTAKTNCSSSGNNDNSEPTMLSSSSSTSSLEDFFPPPRKVKPSVIITSIAREVSQVDTLICELFCQADEASRLVCLFRHEKITGKKLHRFL